jgi:dihydropyrimidinase
MRAMARLGAPLTGSGGRLLVAGGTLVDASGSRRGDVLVEDQRIASVGLDLPAEGATVVDASGALVIPGGIDVHTHFDLPVGAVRSADDFESGTIAAACGGTTCVIDFAGEGREPPDEALAVWHERAARAAVDYGFHLTVTSVPEDQEAAARLFAGFVDAGVTSVKLYMAYPERLMVDDATLARAFAAGVRAGVLVCVHAEDGLAVERLVRDRLEAGDTGPDAIPRARPPVVEADAIRRAATLATEAGSPVYVVHLSSAAGLEAVRSANEGGARVLAETCPQYLFLTDEVLRRAPQDAANFVCQPPVRTDTDREALWDGLAAGAVKLISTDHCPFTIADRRAGVTGDWWSSFAEIPGGQPGVETRLGLAFQGVREGRYRLERWVELVAGAPARLFGLAHRKGALQAGLDADLVVFDPEATRRLDADSLHMRTDHSPYAGLEVRGWPAVTVARGRIVARDGEPADVQPGWGRFVPRERSAALARPGGS